MILNWIAVQQNPGINSIQIFHKLRQIESAAEMKAKAKNLLRG